MHFPRIGTCAFFSLNWIFISNELWADMFWIVYMSNGRFISCLKQTQILQNSHDQLNSEQDIVILVMSVFSDEKHMAFDISFSVHHNFNTWLDCVLSNHSDALYTLASRAPRQLIMIRSFCSTFWLCILLYRHIVLNECNGGKFKMANTMKRLMICIHIS